MKVINGDRAKTFIRLLPDYIRDSIPGEVIDWKEKIFTKLPQAIELDKPDEIDLWLNCLDIFTNSDLYTFTLEEVEKVLLILFKFITTSDHWKLVSQACQLFISIFRPRTMKLSIKLDWHPLYTIVQKLILSRSKTKHFQPPVSLFANIILLIRACTDLFEDTAVQEMLDLWMPLFEPHHHSLVLGHCLICLFLPVNNDHQDLWFDKFFSLWPMFHAETWDYQWLTLFERASDIETSKVDWEPYLPFLFNTLANYLNVPISALDSTNISINDYQIDMYRVFYLGLTSYIELLPSFTYIIINLLTSKCKDSVRKHLETIIFLLEPYCSPIAIADDDPTPELTIFFINSLIARYIKRVSMERKNPKCFLHPLTQDDHNWFVNLLLPIMQMERFCADSQISYVKDFASLAPSIVVPVLIETVYNLMQYEKLQISAIKTIISLIPICIYFDQNKFELQDIILKFSEILNPMDVDQSLRMFSLFSVYVSCVGIREEDEEMNLVVTKKALDFIERLNDMDYETCGELTNNWIAVVCGSASPRFVERVVKLFMDIVDRLSPLSISDIVRSISTNGMNFFVPKAFEAKTIQEFAILRGIFTLDRGIVVQNVDKILTCIKRGLDDSEKKIQRMATHIIKLIFISLLQTAPYTGQPNSFTTVDTASINWHIPSDEEIDCADKVCDNLRIWADEFLACTSDVNKQIIGISIISNMAKGLRFVISNWMFDPIIVDDLVQPKMVHRDCLKLKRHWLYMLDKLTSFLEIDQPEKIINVVLKILPMLLVPKDQRDVDARDENAKIKSMKELLAVGVVTDAVTARFVRRRILQIYNFRNSVMNTPYTKQIDKTVQKIAKICTHPSPKIRCRCALFVQETSAIFPDQFGPFFESLIKISQECLDDKNKLSGLVQSLCSCCQLVFTAANFATIAKAALLVCRPFPNDIPEDTVRNLRQFIIMAFDIVDLNEKRFIDKAFLETRKYVIETAIKNYEEYRSDSEVESYATALVISMAQNRTELLSYDVFNFLISKLVKDDSSLREAVMQTMPSFIEQLIARVQKRKRFPVNKVTPENYDDALFKDRFLKGLSEKEPHFLTIEELVDVNKVAEYFPTLAEERVRIHKLLIQQFVDSGDAIDKICSALVNSQVHQEESYSKMRVQFWVSIIRLLGPPFVTRLINQMEKLTISNANVAQHVIAGELFSSVMFALKGWKFARIQEIIPQLLPFIARVVREGESDFQSVWFVSVVCGLSDHDPQRFYWLFDELLSVIPPHITQIREVKTASLVVDILMEFAWRSPELIKPIIEKAVRPMFEEKAQQFEQIRECSIRAVSSLFSTFFSLFDEGIPPEAQELFDFICKAGDNFLIAWLTAQFTTQALSSIIVNRLAINKIAGWLDIALGKSEDEEKRARGCLLHLIRSNWLWTCASRPLTKESALPVIQKIYTQLSMDKRTWQGQAVILFLNYAFYEQNYFFFRDAEVKKITDEVILPALESSNFDVQVSASEAFTYLLKSSKFLRQHIPVYLDKYRKYIFSGESTSLKIAGVKALFSIIQSTVLFLNVPDYITDAFETLSEAQQINQMLEPHISQGFSDFWSVYNQNLTLNVADQLERFRESMRPSYFC